MGDAEAYAIEAKAKAEAEQMAKKADAWKDYQDAAMVDMVLETIPKVSGTTQGQWYYPRSVVLPKVSGIVHIWPM